MTELASQGLSLMHTFNAYCGKPFLGWKAEMAAPPGPSTGGGMQPLQHITLISPSGARLAAGHVDNSSMVATLRSYEALSVMHEQRFGQKIDVPPDEFQKFLDRATLAFSGAEVAVRVETFQPQPPPVMQARSQPTESWLPFALIAATVAIAVAVVGWLLL